MALAHAEIWLAGLGMAAMRTILSVPGDGLGGLFIAISGLNSGVRKSDPVLGKVTPNIDPLDCLSMRVQCVLVWAAPHEFTHQVMREIRAIINDTAASNCGNITNVTAP
jgi:hypothetical protein